MPALGMSQDTGILIAWLKHEGDTVEKGELIMEVETDKATVEVEAQGTGTLVNLTAQAGDEVPVGEVIALILKDGEAAPAPAKAATAQPSQPEPAPPSPTPTNGTGKSATPVAARMAEVHNVDISRVPATGDRITRADMEAYLNDGKSSEAPVTDVVLASPKARRLARERDIDIEVISGTGPDGAVITADVLAYEPPVAAQPTQTVAAPAAAQADGAVQTGRMWQRMAQRLTESWQTVPHFYLKREVNVSQLIAWRTRLKARAEVKVTFTDLLVYVVARALRQHPYVNGGWDGQGVVFNDEVNVGLAVAVDDGLLVPVIHHADQLGVMATAQARDDIVSRALDGKLKPDDLQGGTFSISNLGMYGIDEFKAIVNPPQAAILAVGNIVEKFVPIDGEAVIQPMMTLSLSCDHRAVDGAHGADFLRTLAQYLQDPMQMLE